VDWESSGQIEHTSLGQLLLRGRVGRMPRDYNPTFVSQPLLSNLRRHVFVRLSESRLTNPLRPPEFSGLSINAYNRLDHWRIESPISATNTRGLSVDG
jgi:hypothetical protein